MCSGLRSNRLTVLSRLAPILLLLLVAITPLHIDATKVRYGNVSQFDPARNDKVGVVDSKEVYTHIPSYKRIVDEKIEKGSAKYTKLMMEATATYRKSIFKIGNSHYVLIVEKGGVTDYPVTNVTEQCIEAL